MEIQTSLSYGFGFAPTVPDLGKPANDSLMNHLLTWLTSCNIAEGSKSLINEGFVILQIGILFLGWLTSLNFREGWKSTLMSNLGVKVLTKKGGSRKSDQVAKLQLDITA